MELSKNEKGLEKPKVFQKKIKQAAKKHITTMKSTGSKLKSEVKKNVLKATLAAFAFVIALVWRDAIRSGVDEIIKRVGMDGTGYIY